MGVEWLNKTVHSDGLLCITGMVEYHESLIQADQWLEKIFKLRIKTFFYSKL